MQLSQTSPLRPFHHLAGRPDHHVLEQQAQVDVGVVAEADGGLSLGAQSAVGRLHSGEVGRAAHRFCGVTYGALMSWCRVWVSDGGYTS